MQQENPFEEAVKEYTERRGIRPSNIIVPATELLDELYDALGVRDFDELFPSQKDLDEAVVSWFSVDLLSKKSAPGTIDGIKIIKRKNSRDGYPIYYIEGLLLSDRARASLDGRLVFAGKHGSQSKEELDQDQYERMPKDVFHHLVLTGNIKGKDLISLCLASNNIQKKCDADDGYLFRKLLKRDFGVDDYSLEGESAREVYFNYSKTGVTVSWPKVLDFGLARNTHIYVWADGDPKSKNAEVVFPQKSFETRRFDGVGSFLDSMDTGRHVFVFCITDKVNPLQNRNKGLPPRCSLVKFTGTRGVDLTWKYSDEKLLDYVDSDPVPVMLPKGLLYPTPGPEIMNGPAALRVFEFRNYFVLVVPVRFGHFVTRSKRSIMYQ